MDQKKIVIINISKGIIGPENMRLLGGMLITKIQLAAMSRANLDEASLKRIPNTYLYVDEFQNFANESFAEILSESRKYKLCLTVANQYMDQMTEEVRNAVIGNVGTFISFRVGSTDAEIMEKEFAPNFVAEDMVNLGFTQMYMKLMIDGIGSRPFSANSLPPIPKPENSYIEDIIGYSRKHFSGEKEPVEEKINEWTRKDFSPAKEFSSTPRNNFDQSGSQNDLPRPKREFENKPRGERTERTDRPERNNDRNGDRPAARNSDRNSDRGDNRVTPQRYSENKDLRPRREEKRDDRRDDRSRERNTERTSDRNSSRNSDRNNNSQREVPRENTEEKPAINTRKKALQNMQKIHALAANDNYANKGTVKKSKNDTLDEVPEDILKALLDTGNL